MQTVLPIREMIKRGWLEQSDATMLQAQLTRFFDAQNLAEIPGVAHAPKRTAGELSPAQYPSLHRVRQIPRSISVPAHSENALPEAASRALASLRSAPDAVR